MNKSGPKQSYPGDSFSAQLLANRTGDNLGESAKIFRDAFVVSYILDFNGAAALARCGWTGKSKKVAHTKSYSLLREPYVANRVAELVRTLKETDVVQRNQVLARMWEEANNELSDPHARIAALAHVAKMLGMCQVKTETPDVPLAVMLVPVENGDWSTAAQTMQSFLKSRVQSGGVPPPPPPRPAGLN